MNIMLVGALPELLQKYAEMERRALASPRKIKFTVAPFGAVRSQSDTTRIMTYRDNDYAVYLKQLKAKNPNAIPIAKSEWRKIAPFGSSYHNYGAAFDVEPTEIDGVDIRVSGINAHIWHDDPKRARVLVDAAINELAHIGIAVGLGRVTNDPPHFQLPYSLAEVRAKWFAAGKPVGGSSPLLIVSGLAILGLLILGISKWTR